LQHGLPEKPALRALAVHPQKPEIIYAGTQSGPYRSADRGEHWEKIELPDHGLPVWSILFHPHNPDVILIGSENSEIYRSDDAGQHWTRLPVSVRFPDITTTPGANPAKRILMLDASASEPDHLYGAIEVGGTIRSTDGGEHWEKVELPDHGLPVWSILFHPHNPDVILVGSENSEIYRSDDAGEHWTRLPVAVRFPEITTVPGANPAKRVLMLDASTSEPDHLYGAIEVGGAIRSTDGGEHWENLSHGQYINDDMCDMHGVLASRWRPGTVFAIARAGMWKSADGGDHWTHIPLEPLNMKGQIYCRDIREVPGNPRHLWCAAGAGFISDSGVLLRSRDGGDSWSQIDVGGPVPHTMFKIAFDERQPSLMSCATNGGEVWTSRDAGETWKPLPPPPGGTQIYALARG
ncbi:MAG: hypothetical protein JO032_01120, partial [Alphaproteobacteria bacterium]|nr:hypothetical protein [Alphaproteobacteria bacterium]